MKESIISNNFRRTAAAYRLLSLGQGQYADDIQDGTLPNTLPPPEARPIGVLEVLKRYEETVSGKMPRKNGLRSYITTNSAT